MAVPFRRTSKTAKRLRRGHFKLTVTGLVACPHCGTLIKAHRVCPKCGYYAGKDVLHLSAKEKKAAPKAAKSEK
jgi:large subunit ribosomal protein L32